MAVVATLCATPDMCRSWMGEGALNDIDQPYRCVVTARKLIADASFVAVAVDARAD